MLENKIKKIPGRLPPISSKDKESIVEDISKLPKPKLLELIDRQKKIVNNRAFLNKLPDKGTKLTSNYEKLLNELKTREETEANLCNLMSSLAVDKKEVEDFEWTGSCNPGSSKNCTPAETLEESDSDDVDPLKILANHAGAGFAKKEIRFEKAEESLIKESDLKMEDPLSSQVKPDEQGKENATALQNVEEYAVHLCEKFDAGTSSKKIKFYPHRTIKEKHVKRAKENVNLTDKPWWEVTAATPPLPVHDNVKIVSLKESLIIQQKQAEQLKEIQVKHAAERLTRMRGVFPDRDSLPVSYTDYRDQKESDSDESSENGEKEGDEEKECHDEEVDQERDVAVFYNVVD